MAKKSHRRLVNHESRQSGCMSGFIGIFDFRHGRSTRKLLSDKKHGSNRHAATDTALVRSKLKLSNNSDKRPRGKDTNLDNISDGDETEALMAGSNKTSVKKLIEEDMSNEQQTEKQVANAAKEQIQSDPVCQGSRGKNHKKTKETCKVSTTLESQEFSQTNSAKRLSLLDITSLMEEFCSQIQQHQEIRLHNESGVDSCGTLEYTDSEKHGQPGELDMHKFEKHSVLQEKLSEAAAAFLNQKLIDTKQFKEDGSIHQSKQFIDALEILNSNKELLLKFLQNSNSLGAKCIREVQDTHTPFEKVKQEKFGSKLPKGTGSSERGKELACRKEVQKHNIHNFFRKKDKSQKRDSSEESDCSQVSNRIVVLKPTATSSLSTSTAISSISPPRSHYSLKNEGWSGRSNSPFSLGEIKKRLKNTLGENKKDRQWFFMDGMLHKIPNKHQVSEVSSNTDKENIDGKDVKSKYNSNVELSNSGGKEKIENPNPCYLRTAHEVASTSAANPRNPAITSVGYPKQGEANIYLEAKKHLEELLTSTGDDVGSPIVKSPKTLGKILSLPDYTCSPLWSPDGEHGFITAQMRLSSNGSFRIVNENIWRFKLDNSPSQPSPSRENLEIQHEAHAHGDSNSDIIIREIDSKTDSSENGTKDCVSVCSTEDSILKGNGESTEETNIACLEEDHLPGRPMEANGDTSTISTSAKTKISDEEEEEEFTKCLRLNSSQDDQQTSSSLRSSSSNSLQLEKVGSLENINDLPERPSPISVLEPFFDDVNSPTASTPYAELQIKQLHFEDEEDNCATMVITSSDLQKHPEQCIEDYMPLLEFVTAVLQASGMKWGELWDKNSFSDLLLSPSLFDEVEYVQAQDCGDSKLLFDCTNEVLTDLYKRHNGSSPWVAFVNPDIRPAPKGNNMIQEVWEGIKWNLPPPLMPHTLDQIIGKDMEKCRTWMDLRPDVEAIGNEMVDVILEEIVEGSLFDLCS